MIVGEAGGVTFRVLARTLTVVFFVVGVVVGAVVLSHVASGHKSPARNAAGESSAAASIADETTTAPESGRRSRAMQILADWDAKRAAAYAAADQRALAGLYLSGSRTGDADVHLLEKYADRGLRVEGMATQMLTFDVIRHDSGRLVVDVTDRVVGAVAVGHGHRVKLPADRADRRRVSLVRRGGRWLVAEVT